MKAAAACAGCPIQTLWMLFFLRGQREGLFRIDISAPVLTETFASLLFGLVDAERRGRVARTGMDAVLLQMFMQGARSGA